MIELPEAMILSEQLSEKINGKTITDVVANFSPHKFAWFNGNPDDYPAMLAGWRITGAANNGGQVEIFAEDFRIVLTDGVNLRYIEPGGKLPPKHQLLIGFDDDSCIVASVQMYGGLWAFEKGKLNHSYYLVAKERPHVLSDEFTEDYFMEMTAREDMRKKSVKALLATDQSVPGLGNGVLQDMLYNAGLNPKRKTATLSDGDRQRLYRCVRDTMGEIYRLGGRSSEKDLFGVKGGYIPFLSKDTCGRACSRCGSIIVKENYLGGSIYYCPGCQK